MARRGLALSFRHYPRKNPRKPLPPAPCRSLIVLDSRQVWHGLGFACGAGRVRSWRRKVAALKRLGEARALQRVLMPRAKSEAALRPWALMAMAALASAAAPDLAARATATARQAIRVSSLAGLVRWVASRSKPRVLRLANRHSMRQRLR